MQDIVEALQDKMDMILTSYLEENYAFEKQDRELFEMTVQKECQMCKKLFVTRTAKSARWEKHCLECYLKVKNTKSFQLKRYEEFEETKLKSN